ncbi:ABC transporter ATP-binding protein [Leptospira ellinghausenii]|uniref:ABC transporter ATP-binding protein n=1 Tax=Leptospira ellinghausenii TaxID=1917822 RepID=A0A2P2D9Z7_9LEPT|nr:ATP-binding cassette domain-containing protein [Leptospira ellinghausenii]GBF41449.1 ABC transporter ATP-binding protein [Leptospira ellinghausenii]
MFKIKNLSVHIGKRSILNDVSLEAKPKEITGLIGKSGSGKSTLFRLALGLLPKSEGYEWTGELEWNGAMLGKQHCPKIQPVFQDPFGSFSPYNTIGELLLEPLKVQKHLFLNQRVMNGERTRIESFCDRFELPTSLLSKTKRELSGGQLQRFAILRALLMNPEYLLLDEPVTALDVLVQKKIAEELKEINQKDSLGMLIVSHDLGFLSYMCDQIFVLEEGSITEFGNPKQLLKHPQSKLLQELVFARNHSFGGVTSSSESSN